jgi:signal peptidase I
MNQTPFREAFRLLVGVLVAALVTHTWLLMGLIVPVMVAGSSMAPTLQDTHRLLIDRTAFAFRQPQRWEVVVFRSPEDARQLCVKRIVGLPGETVSMVHGKVLINGQLIGDPRDTDYEIRYGDYPQKIAPADGGNLAVHEGWQLGPSEFFVLGDNAAISDDSRSWWAGPGLDAKLLVGRPLGIR